MHKLRRRFYSFVLTAALVAFAPSAFAPSAFAPSAFAQPRSIEQNIAQPENGVTVLSSDAGAFGGPSMGTSHQNTFDYWTEKTFVIPAGALEGVKQARLRAYILVRDNSSANGGTYNGLDEAFEFVVNGHAHSYQTNAPGLPTAAPREPLIWKWHDFPVPVQELKVGENKFIFHKKPAEKNDDYLYFGIDNTVSAGQSRISLDGGKTWSDKQLNTIGAQGEYMARLILLNNVPQNFAEWTPQKTSDDGKLIGFFETDAAKQTASFEIDVFNFDASQPFDVTVNFAGATPALRGFDEDGQALPVGSTPDGTGVLKAKLNDQGKAPARLEIVAPAGQKLDLQKVRFDYSIPVGGMSAKRIDMAPRVLPARGKPINRAPKIIMDKNGFTAHNATLAARFETSPHFRLASLRSEWLQKNILAHPEHTRLFLIESEGKRFGAQEWQVRGVKTISPTQVVVQLALPSPKLEADFSISVDVEQLRFGLKITNASTQTQSWKTAFPHLGGLQLSQSEKNDHYLFPLWGGAIADVNASLRTFYGDESAWWQMVDVFSPDGGAGLMLRSLDETGLWKGVSLRKGQTLADGAQFSRELRTAYMEPEMGWTNTLEAAPGVAATFEYLKYTRVPNASFAPPDAAIQMHAGDWHSAMQEYSRWAHKVWKWQPWPNTTRDVWNITASGWGQSPLYKDGKWREDAIESTKGKADVLEIMSWWQWSKKGPWRVPMDKLEEELGESFFKAYKNYWVVNPATGQLEYPLNRGDYEYNEDWGGLPALRDYLAKIRAAGIMPMFYTDPLLADDNTKLGHEYGPQYGVMNSIWKASGYASEKKTPPGYVGAYGGWVMCLDTQWYQDFVVDLAARLVRDTGVDGIRYDEYGHRGYTCNNPKHKHIFAEPGHNAWLQAVALNCRRTQEAVKKIKPDFVLTAEFPGNDFVAATLEGAVNYESAQHVFRGFRPIPLNVMRFYFPEHKHFDLDTSGRKTGPAWRFWNATGTSFGALHPPQYHRILEENSDTFDTRDAIPLAPSLAQGVYANRFSGGGKTITLLYNARGFTVDEPLISAPAKTGFHYFDLLHGKEIAPQNGAIAMKLQPNAVAAIALLPEVLQVQKVGGGWKFQFSRDVPDATLALCNADGEILSRAALPASGVLPAAGDAAHATSVKLFAGKYLLDAAQLP
jgi:hypothetical protein